MPYKKDYTMHTVKKGGSRTPMSVMGSQGSPAKIPASPSSSKPTKKTKFMA